MMRAGITLTDSSTHCSFGLAWHSPASGYATLQPAFRRRLALVAVAVALESQLGVDPQADFVFRCRPVTLLAARTAQARHSQDLQGSEHTDRKLSHCHWILADAPSCHGSSSSPRLARRNASTVVFHSV